MQNYLIFERALQLIERYGWIQGSYGDPTRGYCLTGACKQAASDLGDPSGGVRAVSVLGGALGEPVPHWNDRNGRTDLQAKRALAGAINTAFPN